MISLFGYVIRRVGSDKPKPACLLPRRLGTHEFRHVSLRLQFNPTVVFYCLHNTRM